MRNFYIRKLRSQELGSPKSDGTVSRGRYFLISKAYGTFFPYLSPTVNNDNVLIPIIPAGDNTKVYSTLVYHNDKHNVAGGSRDEFRLYLNKVLDPDKRFQVDDIVVFERVENETVIPIYILHRFEITNPQYKLLLDILDNVGINDGHAFFDGDLDFIPPPQNYLDEVEVRVPLEILGDVITQQAEIVHRPDAVELTRGAHLFGPDSFRDFVLLAYNYKCAITATEISYKALSNLEAAHIKPKAHAGTFLPCNGIALCRDMHWAFDKGFITIREDLTVEVHEAMKTSSLSPLHGKPIYVPKDSYFQPEKTFLQHHQNNIFGLFLHSGSIRCIVNPNK